MWRVIPVFLPEPTNGRFSNGKPKKAVWKAWEDSCNERRASISRCGIRLDQYASKEDAKVALERVKEVTGTDCMVEEYHLKGIFL